MKFKKGDKIVCINNNNDEDWFENARMHIGEQYTVKQCNDKILYVEGSKDIFPYSCGRFVTLEEFRKIKIEKIKNEIQKR